MSIHKPRRTTAVLALAVLAVVPLTIAHAAPQASSDVAYLKGESALVPVRAIFEWLGAEVEFSKGNIVAAKGDTTVRLKTGSVTAWIGDKETKLSVAPTLIGGKTYVPLRFVAESFGAEVGYDAKAHKVTVAQGGKVLVMAAKALPQQAAKPATIKMVYVDKSGSRGLGDVHIVYADGRDARITAGHNSSDARLASDGQTVGWLITSLKRETEADYWTSVLAVWRDGRTVRTFTDGCVHEWAFWQGASHVVMGLGPPDRGTKWLELRSVPTGRLVEQCQDPEYYGGGAVPGWAAALGRR